MVELDFKRYFKEFVRYNKLRIFKIILYSVIILYISFLFCYNYYRTDLSFSLDLSWLYGFVLALIITVIIVLSVDILGFYINIRRTPLELLEQ